MERKLVVIGIVIILLGIGLSGCSEQENTVNAGITITNNTDSEVTITYSVESDVWSTSGTFTVQEGESKKYDYGTNPPEGGRHYDHVVTASYPDSDLSDTGGVTNSGSYSFKYTIYGSRYLTGTPSIDIQRD